MVRIKRLLVGGSVGNEQLTALVAAVLLLLLAIEGATLLQIRSLLTVHAFVIVWVGATSLHVLAHAPKLPRLLRARIPGTGLRVALVAGTVVAGAVLATATLPGADQLQDRASAHIGFDER